MTEYDNVAKALGLEKVGAEGILKYLSGKIDHRKIALEEIDERLDRGENTRHILRERRASFGIKKENSDARGDSWNHYDKIYDGLCRCLRKKEASLVALRNEREDLYKLDFQFN